MTGTASTMPTSTPDDPHDLQRFVAAQEPVYEQALGELRAGAKRSHWMWFVFPQLKALGRSATAQRFGIEDLREAEAYWRHPLLGPRLKACTEALLATEGRSALQILGPPDDLKLASSMTLFARAAPDEPAFGRALDKYFGGRPDARTLELLG